MEDTSIGEWWVRINNESWEVRKPYLWKAKCSMFVKRDPYRMPDHSGDIWSRSMSKYNFNANFDPTLEYLLSRAQGRPAQQWDD